LCANLEGTTTGSAHLDKLVEHLKALVNGALKVGVDGEGSNAGAEQRLALAHGGLGDILAPLHIVVVTAIGGCGGPDVARRALGHVCPNNNR
jgi:hypothetical protein